MNLTDAEWILMRALWRHSPATARDVLEGAASESDWAYTTVKTMLARLVEKGALRETRRGNRALYEPTLTRQQARRTELRRVVDRAFEGTVGSLLQHLVANERLTRRDRDRLTAMLDDLAPEEPTT